jgi:hypothetical protein
MTASLKLSRLHPSSAYTHGPLDSILPDTADRLMVTGGGLWGKLLLRATTALLPARTPAAAAVAVAVC